jgi:hypothetical protein
MSGFLRARELGFTHAVLLDADGQHDLSDIPRFLSLARANPAALIAGRPLFDETAPTSRSVGRVISRLWAAVETGRPVIADPLCGFRVYPIEAALAARPLAQRMDFDNEIAVRMAWNGTPVVNVPTRVRYRTEDEGGVSHYHLLWDNVRMSWMHTRLACQSPYRLLMRLARGGLP